MFGVALVVLALGCSDDTSVADVGTDPDVGPGGDVGAQDQGPPAPGTFSEVDAFGTNPGNLRMHTYVPGAMPSTPAGLVVVLHGCQVSATEQAESSGWNDIADRHQLYLVYPEQSASNNPNTCFNWFQPSDYGHKQGESQSIVEMVEKMKQDHTVDPSRIFVTGLSAGAAMAVALGAVYPDLFAGVAAMAGIPFGCATDAASGIGCMNGVDKTPAKWGDLVRGARPGYSGPYPRMVVFHGDKDGMIDYAMLAEFAEQWLDVHKADTTPEVSDVVQGKHTHEVFNDASGQPVVETFLLKGMGHGIAVDPDQGGKTSWFSYDVGLWSTLYAARFWGLAPP